MIESGITRGTIAAQLALLLLGYGLPDAPQWIRACVALLAGCLGALSAALQAGPLVVAGVLPIVGQGLAAAVAALGLTASAGAVQQKRRRAGVAGRHGTAP
jgi:hypothetical protein